MLYNEAKLSMFFLSLYGFLTQLVSRDIVGLRNVIQDRMSEGLSVVSFRLLCNIALNFRVGRHYGQNVEGNRIGWSTNQKLYIVSATSEIIE